MRRHRAPKVQPLRGESRAARCEDGRQPTGDTALAVRGDEASASSAGAAFRPHHPGPRPASSTVTSMTLLDDTHRQQGLTETCAEGCRRARESRAGHGGDFQRSRAPRVAALLGRQTADRVRWAVCRPITSWVCTHSSGRPRDTNMPAQPILLSTLSHLWLRACGVRHPLMRHDLG